MAGCHPVATSLLPVSDLSPDAGASYALRIPHLFEGLPQPRIGARGRFLILAGHQVAILREREGRLAVPEP